MAEDNTLTPTQTTEAPVAPKVTRAKNPIRAYREDDKGDLIDMGGPFNEYTEFKAWVKAQAQEGVEFIPMRVVGRSLTVQTVKKTTLV